MFTTCRFTNSPKEMEARTYYVVLTFESGYLQAWEAGSGKLVTCPPNFAIEDCV